MWQGRPAVSAWPHGRVDRQGGHVADGEPPGVAGLDLVTARAAAQRAGMEADRERLAHQPGTWVGNDVTGVGVDSDQAGDLHGDARFLGGLPDRRIGRALAGIDVPAGQFPVAGVADRGERARGHATGGGGAWLMVVLAAEAVPPGPRPVPGAGRADRARGPVLPGRGTRARNVQTPHRIAGVLIRMAAEPLRVRRARGSHDTPFHRTKGGMRAGSVLVIPRVAVLGPRRRL